MNRDIILASKSETRIKLLRNAGISFEAVAHGVDEEEVKMSMSKNTPEEIVVKLAEMKALKPSMSNKSAFVIGSDQGLDLKGELINKARDRNEAKEQLMKMSGSVHTLITATTVAQDNNIIWKYVDRSKMHMRKLSEDLIKEYLNKVDDNILGLVGVYAIEEEGIKLFENIDLKNKKITCEVCVHHLWFDESDYEKLGNFIVCNPAIKKVSDRNALRKALKDGFIDYVATDHAPHSYDDKKLPYGKAPAGIPLIEHSFHMMIELHKQGYYSLEEVISYMSHKVADRFSIQNRGYVREGYKADLMMFDLDKITSVTNETEKTKCGWTPFDGHTFSSAVLGTIINGKPIVVDGKLTEDSSSAEQILFDR